MCIIKLAAIKSILGPGYSGSIQGNYRASYGPISEPVCGVVSNSTATKDLRRRTTRSRTPIEIFRAAEEDLRFCGGQSNGVEDPQSVCEAAS